MKNILKWFTQKKKGRSKNVFAKYGHTCVIPEEKDDVAEYYSSKTWWQKLRKTCFHFRTVSGISKTYTRHLRSHGSIMEERKRHLLEYNHIIHPYSYFRVIWNIMICTVILAQLILVPIYSGYCDEDGDDLENESFFSEIFYMIIFLDLFLCLDIVVNMFTGFYSEQKKEVVLDAKLIFFHYLNTYLIPDLISSIPFNINILGINDHNIILAGKIAGWLKLLRFFTFVKYYNRIMTFFRVRHSCSSFLLLLIGLGIYWHCLSCCLMMVKHLDAHFMKEHARIVVNVVSRGEVYVTCFYEASMIIYTSWYTQQKPEGIIEFFVVTLMWFCSKTTQFFILARTMQIMKGMNSSHQKYVEMERQLREYMRDKQLPSYMRARLLAYYEYRFQKNYYKESEILSTISGQLRQEIVMHSCRQLVENVTFFKNLPINLLVRIVSCLTSEMYLMNDVITRANTPGDCMYFIASGTVAVYSTSGKEICHLEDGNHFGEIALVKKYESRIASVVALEICEVYRFDAIDFVRAIHPYPDLLDSIEKIAADRMEKTMMLDEHNRRELLALKRSYN